MFQGASSTPIRGWGHGASGIVGVIPAVLPAMLLMGSLQRAESRLWPGPQRVPGFQRQLATELNMSTNKDQVKGALKDIAGKIQEEAGKLFGSTEQRVKGLKNQAKGKIQKGVGDLKEAVSNAKKAAKK